jgi:hypothetical protein
MRMVSTFAVIREIPLLENFLAMWRLAVLVAEISSIGFREKTPINPAKK